MQRLTASFLLKPVQMISQEVLQDNILTARQISKSYGRKSVLEKVDLSIRQGRIYGITGENGSGKTTLIKILAGFMKPDTGYIIIKGKLGFCPQEPLVFNNLTVEENINFFCRAYGIPSVKKENIGSGYISEIINHFGFSEYLGYVGNKLSGGTLQKLNLTLSLIHDPDILLLDEPYSAFDWETYLKFWDYALKLKHKGKTILIVSHLLYDRQKIDEIWRIEKGQLVCE